jgi:hypothetical protein
MCKDTVQPLLDKYRDFHRKMLDFSDKGVEAAPIHSRKFLVVGGFGPLVRGGGGGLPHPRRPTPMPPR